MLCCVCFDSTTVRQPLPRARSPAKLYAGACGLDLEHHGSLVVSLLTDRCIVITPLWRACEDSALASEPPTRIRELPCSYKTRWCPLPNLIHEKRDPPWVGERARAPRQPDCALALVSSFSCFISWCPHWGGFLKGLQFTLYVTCRSCGKLHNHPTMSWWRWAHKALTLPSSKDLKKKRWILHQRAPATCPRRPKDINY